MRMTMFQRYVVSCLLAVAGYSAACGQEQELAGGRLNAPVNDSLNDYNPVVFYGIGADGQDRLYFTSERLDIYTKGKTSKKARRAEMWVSTRPSVERSRKPLNEGWCDPACELVSTDDEQFPAYTRGAMTMDESRSVVIFASERSLVQGELDGHNTSHMFDLWSTNDNFRTVTPLEQANSEYWDSHPALMPDGRMLFFTSNRPMMLNGVRDSSLNIFYSLRESDGSWSEAQPVPGLNTPGDEVSPHVGADGYFYYASNWKADTTADHDIYRAQLAASGLPVKQLLLEEALAMTVQRPLPPGFRYNSDANDLFPFVAPDRRGLFLASDRDQGRLDIYAWNFPKPVIKLEVTVLEQIMDHEGKLIQAWTPKNQVLQLRGQESRTFASGTMIDLEPGATYTVQPPLEKTLCFACTSTAEMLTISTGSEDIVLRDTFRILCRQQPDSAVVFSDAETGTPYFITGYWWPNTSANLADYRDRMKFNRLTGSNFVDSTDFNYGLAAQRIDEHFEQNIYRRIETIMEQITAQCWSKPVLTITVHGYTDECRLRPGTYSLDGDVTVGDIVIPTGQNMQSVWAQHIAGGKVALPDSGQNGNIFLSKLRAYYTVETIKKEMSARSERFRQLLEAGQIRLDADGFGVFGKKQCDYQFDIPDLGLPADPLNDEPCNKPRSRMFAVYFNIVTPEQADGFRLGRCGKESPEYVRWLRQWQKKQQQILVEQQQREAEQQRQAQEQQQQKQQGGVVAGVLYAVQYGTAASDEDLKVAQVILTTLGYEYVQPKKDENGSYRLLSPPLYSSEEEAQGKLEEYNGKAEALRRLLRPEIVQRQ